jgi:hypothetical protein
MAVGYTAKGDSFAAEKPRRWTEARLRDTGAYSNYDLAPDGKRLAAMVADDATAERPVSAELFRRAPSPRPGEQIASHAASGGTRS